MYNNVHSVVYVWKSEDNFVESSLSFVLYSRSLGLRYSAASTFTYQVLLLAQHMNFNMLILQTIQFSFVALANAIRQEEEIVSFNHSSNRGNTGSGVTPHTYGDSVCDKGA